MYVCLFVSHSYSGYFNAISVSTNIPPFLTCQPVITLWIIIDNEWQSTWRRREDARDPLGNVLLIVGQNGVTIGVCLTTHYHSHGAAIGRRDVSSVYLCLSTRKSCKKTCAVRWFANNFYSWPRHAWKWLANHPHSWPNIVINGSPYIALYLLPKWRGVV